MISFGLVPKGSNKALQNANAFRFALSLKIRVFATLMLLSVPLIAPALSAQNECVVLVHGLARTNASMEKIESALQQSKYKTHNLDYASRTDTIEKLSEQYIPQALEACKNTATIHFVTHSMGGIIVRQYLSQNSITNLGHVLMLGPPNNGSDVVDKLADMPGFALLNGPAGLELCTQDTCLPKALGPANFSLGIIAGDKSMNLILSNMLPNPDDGKVSVESTKLEGMADHIILPVNHTFMMQNKEVIEQVVYFLEYGHFEHDNEPVLLPGG